MSITGVRKALVGKVYMVSRRVPQAMPRDIRKQLQHTCVYITMLGARTETKWHVARVGMRVCQSVEGDGKVKPSVQSWAKLCTAP